MAEVNPATVSALLDPNEASAETAVPIITVMAKAYTRGNGFTGNEPNDDIAAAITTAAARLAANGTQIPVDFTTGQFGKSLRGAFTGWTTAELAVLNRYRRRAA
ncbi:hypothetical protein MCHIJ_43170 [Mycolicibacterium chitae]|uniref:Uncharacterized protein n=1 Tax=Mycolicibacterium chitae TaxID=1792 RepID=A0A448I852_MYCCI|nr:hypothetical protein [Mycolicibacterium chitae]MCV7104212.1 hypothetical protein [Mycolicibacterium chitae]BBZ04880.1 hypothetical protein MCHIJ_43170 [Mycolicibacterium chitae]VEG48504.1 Uncharacterised protein [Mycolicibacterium chitae]